MMRRAAVAEALSGGRWRARARRGDRRRSPRGAGSRAFRVVFLDLWLGADAGLDLLPEMLARQPDLGVIVVTAFASIESAVDAIRRGAVDYVPKPFTPDQIRLAANRVVEGAAPAAPLGGAPGGTGRKRRAGVLRVAQPAFLRFLQTAGARGGIGRRAAPARRKRHRQERARALDSRQQSASRCAVRHRQLPGPFRRPHDERAVRASQRRVHRCGRRRRRQGPGGRRRNAAARRGRRADGRRPGASAAVSQRPDV